LLGQSNENGRYVYLSDGGHFENLGAYELVRRRCRFIVVCDAGADPSFEFFDLGDLIRKCRNDFGIRIEIDVGPIRPQGTVPRSRWHCAIGTVRYDDVDLNALPGMIVYLKASLTGDESSDVLAYADQHKLFPHQSTVDQFFTESQFESYRALGFHIAQEVFGDATKPIDIKGARPPKLDSVERANPRVFSRLRRRWFPPPPDLEANFLESVKGFMAVHQALRKDRSLDELTRDLYPELGDPLKPDDPGASVPGDRAGAELNVISQMLQVMENAWLGLRLGQYYEHPLNRGWMTVFRRWTNSDAFSKYWPALRGQYGQEFVRFCENELKLVLWDIRATRARNNERDRRDLARLSTEFAFEWYREKQEERGLADLQQRAEELAKDLGTSEPFIWIIRVTNASKEGEVDSEEGNIEYACGVILVFKSLFPELATAPEDKFEFFVWIEGPYRNQGIGRDRDCVQQVLETVRAVLNTARNNKPFHLFVRYPEEVDRDGDEPLERALWSNFFHYYGFHRVMAEEFGRKQDVILAYRSD
jgi:hypothetical protein